MNFNLRKISISIGVSVFAFLLGVGSSRIVSHQHSTRNSKEISPFERRVDEWHRLYEAELMSARTSDVRDRLMCANRLGQSEGVMIVDNHGTAWCHLDDGTLKELHFSNDSLPDQILRTHIEWSLHHLDFVESVVNPEKARTYIRQHQWPQ